jgi:hypothetical protein
MSKVIYDTNNDGKVNAADIADAVPTGAITDNMLSNDPNHIKARLSSHMADNANPHTVTATQAGALPATGGHVSGVLSVGNYIRFYPYSKTPGFRRCDTYLHSVSNTILMAFRDENNDSANGEMQINFGTVYHSNNTGKLYVGTGSPEGVLSAPIGALYQRTDGGASTTLYAKESGTGNTGWKAVQTV